MRKKNKRKCYSSNKGTSNTIYNYKLNGNEIYANRNLFELCNKIAEITPDIPEYDFYKHNRNNLMRFLIGHCIKSIFNMIKEGKDVSDITRYSITKNSVSAVFKIHIKDIKGKHIMILAHTSMPNKDISDLSYDKCTKKELKFVLLNEMTKDSIEKLMKEYSIDGDYDNIKIYYKNNSIENKNKKFRRNNIVVIFDRNHFIHIANKRENRLPNFYNKLDEKTKYSILKSSIIRAVENFDEEIVYLGRKGMGKNTENDFVLIPIFIGDREVRKRPDLVLVGLYIKKTNTIVIKSVFDYKITLENLCILPYCNKKWVKELKRKYIASDSIGRKNLF